MRMVCLQLASSVTAVTVAPDLCLQATRASTNSAKADEWEAWCVLGVSLPNT